MARAGVVEGRGHGRGGDGGYGRGGPAGWCFKAVYLNVLCSFRVVDGVLLFMYGVFHSLSYCLFEMMFRLILEDVGA